MSFKKSYYGFYLFILCTNFTDKIKFILEKINHRFKNYYKFPDIAFLNSSSSVSNIL